MVVATDGKKRGVKKGTKLVTKISRDWFIACEYFRSNNHSLNQTQFLKSDLSGDSFTGTLSERQSFGRKLKQYDDDNLKSSTRMRIKKGEFEDVEKMLVKYIDLRAEKYKRDKCGLNWATITSKSLLYARQCGYTQDEFKGSPGWIDNVLKRNDKVGINLHGEAADMDDDEREVIMDKWRTSFWATIEKHNITRSCVYNADQTGLYHQKLPNRMYVNANEKKDYAGVKRMKDKTRITLMMCTAADGRKCPLAIVGKAKKPMCFRLTPDQKPPIAYTHQHNAWFDRNVTLWWIWNVLWPWHMTSHGHGKACILILDNCSAHDVDKNSVPKYLIIIFLPPNVTNRHQPADMGMIASVKVGYRIIMLNELLSIFDSEGGYKEAATARALQKKDAKV